MKYYSWPVYFMLLIGAIILIVPMAFYWGIIDGLKYRKEKKKAILK